MNEVETQTAVVVEPVRSEETPISIARDVLSLALFDHGATAVTQTPNGALLAGFLDHGAADAAIAAIPRAHPTLVTHIEIANDADHDWAVSQRGGFTPTRVGDWHIRTPWTPAPDDVKPMFAIQIDPGKAFGHGAHPSTRLAATLMTPHLAPGRRVLDVGTGTGVLAIMAARAGATVRAIDNDSTAIEVARSNIELNACEPFDEVAVLIDLELSDATELSPEIGQLVVANVTLDVHRAIAASLQAVNHVIISGILERQVRDIRQLYPSHCAKTISCVEEWAAVDLISEQGSH